VQPQAEIVSAGIPQPGTGQGVDLLAYVAQILGAGGAGALNTLAIHPYQATVADVLGDIAGIRALLNAAGYRSTPIWITEIGWASGGPPSGFTVGPRQQAHNVLYSITDLGREAARMRIRGVVYSDWRDAKPYPGHGDFWGLHTGLERLNGDGKPALTAYFVAAGVLRTLPSRRRHP
jgi:hypothetical protein